jgi:hypothetical protein
MTGAVRVVASVTGGTLKLDSIPANVNATIRGYGSATSGAATSIAFEGSLADISTALGLLKAQRTGTDPAQVDLSAIPAITSGNTWAYNPANGHFYEAVERTGGVSWMSAKDLSEARQFNGMHGYLTTSTSSSENELLVNHLAVDAWLGASDSGIEGTWIWASGPETGSSVAFNRFDGIQPDNYGDEDYLQLVIAKYWGPPGTWNDLPNDSASWGPKIEYFIVEYGGMLGDNPTFLERIKRIDLIAPVSITISSDKTALRANEAATITFELSEASTDFDVSDITITDGALTNFSGSGTSYSASFVPIPTSDGVTGVLTVASNKFSNNKGEFNQDGLEANNTVSVVFDLVNPTIEIVSNRTILKAGETATLTFTLSESSTDFTSSDLSVAGGTVSGFSGSGTTYTATFTPTADSTVNGVVSIASNTFSDAAGNSNDDGADTDNTVTMTVDTIRPKVAITSDKTSLKVGEAAALTFTLSEASTDFADSDVSFAGGTLSGFSGTGTNYTATFTPTANSTANGVVSVASSVFSNAAGNFNNDGAEFNNTVTMKVDTVLPTVSISSDKSLLTTGESAVITFTLNEPSTDFDISDVVFKGGTMSSFSGTGSLYTATFTPTTRSIAAGTVSVASSTFSDAAGNNNTDGSDANNNLTIEVDTLYPRIVVASTKSW